MATKRQQRTRARARRAAEAAREAMRDEEEEEEEAPRRDRRAPAGRPVRGSKAPPLPLALGSIMIVALGASALFSYAPILLGAGKVRTAGARPYAVLPVIIGLTAVISGAMAYRRKVWGWAVALALSLLISVLTVVMAIVAGQASLVVYSVSFLIPAVLLLMPSARAEVRPR